MLVEDERITEPPEVEVSPIGSGKLDRLGGRVPMVDSRLIEELKVEGWTMGERS